MKAKEIRIWYIMSSIFEEELGKNNKINTSSDSFIIWLEKLNHILIGLLAKL